VSDMVAELEPRPRLITVAEFHRMWDAYFSRHPEPAETYSELRDGAYAVTRSAKPGDGVAPGAFPADAMAVTSFLPPGPIARA
jgi:hypothetical protein